MNIGAAIREYFEQVVAGWNRFWFQPQDPATLSFIRICAGLMLLYTHLVWSLDLEAFFGQGGWLPREVIATLQQGSYAWSYFWWIDSTWLLWAVHIAGLVVFGMLTVGYHSRVVAVLAYVIAVSYAGRVPGALFGLDKINCMLAMYLMLGPSGAYWSVDRLLARRRSKGPLAPPAPSVSANLAIRLIQLHMCIIYLFSGLGKLQGTAWWDGTAVWMALANLEYQSIDMTWLADWPKLVAFMTHATVFWELFYVALVWHRLWRPVMLLGAVAVHGGIAIGLGMITFGLVMLIGNLAFIPPHMIRAAVDAVFARQRSESPVLEASTA